MTSTRFNAGQVRFRSYIRSLQRCNVFEGVPRHHAVVGVGGGGEDGWIRLAGLDVVGLDVVRLDVMQGRILFEDVKLRFDSRVAILVDPQFTGCEFIKAQHVHHADLRQRGGEQIWPLINHCANQQTPI